MNGRTITPAGTLVLSITAIFLVVLLAYLEVQTLPLGDTVPPGRVEGLTVTPVEGGRLLLQWEAAWDDVGISHYLVRRDAVTLAPEPSVLHFLDENLEPGLSYEYVVVAVDLGGNEGPPSAPVAGVPAR